MVVVGGREEKEMVAVSMGEKKKKTEKKIENEESKN